MTLEQLHLEGFPTIALAAGLGAILGVEREFAGKPAGIRTHMFVCAGSALMMILGQEIINVFQDLESAETFSADPIRILQAIVVGISFLGAGTIVHDAREGVEGLTTAATIYLTAGIGLAVAVERAALAVVITLSAVLVLFFIGWLERRSRRRKTQHTCPSPAPPKE